LLYYDVYVQHRAALCYTAYALHFTAPELCSAPLFNFQLTCSFLFYLSFPFPFLLPPSNLLFIPFTFYTSLRPLSLPLLSPSPLSLPLLSPSPLSLSLSPSPSPLSLPVLSPSPLSLSPSLALLIRLCKRPKDIPYGCGPVPQPPRHSAVEL
jgi:hypothetical protein